MGDSQRLNGSAGRDEEVYSFTTYTIMTWREHLVTIGSSLLAILGLYLYVDGGYSEVGMLFGFVFFGACAVTPLYMNYCARKNPTPAVLISQNGLWFNGLADVLPWALIDRLRLHHFRIKGTRMISVNVDVAESVVRRFKKAPSGPVTRFFNGLIGTNEFSFTISMLNEPPEAVVAIISKFHPVEGTI